MEKITEKIGLFDIWTVLFPGSVFLVIIKTFYNTFLIFPDLVKGTDNVFEKLLFFLQIKIYAPETLYELFELFLGAYLVGLLLQEISSIFKNKILYKNGKPMDYLTDAQGDIFDEVQIQKLISLFAKLNGGELATNDALKQHRESRYLFHRMNTILIDKKIAGQYAKLNALYNTNINLAVVFIMVLGMSLIYEIESIVCFKQYYLTLSLVSLDLVLVGMIYLLIQRGKHCYIYWTRNIVYAYQKLVSEETS